MEPMVPGSRETRELRQETEQMGASLARLVHDMQWCSADQRTSLAAMRPMTLPLVHACVCAALRRPKKQGWPPICLPGSKTKWPQPSKACHSGNRPANASSPACARDFRVSWQTPSNGPGPNHPPCIRSHHSTPLCPHGTKRSFRGCSDHDDHERLQPFTLHRLNHHA